MSSPSRPPPLARPICDRSCLSRELLQTPPPRTTTASILCTSIGVFVIRPTLPRPFLSRIAVRSSGFPCPPPNAAHANLVTLWTEASSPVLLSWSAAASFRGNV
ncbi:hypothetical protein EJ04DRAFT_137484 [Polyplosphaeria fusca]|uniref:Uncharacterized protein n=1 Tax=Polyplosphaeria fusca TaxID=682080 RepID=A0A9P4QJ84_9PLEO|nr:hypothetical protein EJ04DRAFT_137484 [Polyplosphaeria fusca]